METKTIKRDERFSHEKNDCVVLAISRRIKTSYERAHEICSQFRKDGKRCKQTRELLTFLGLECKPYEKSLGQFLKDHPTGCYFLRKLNHAFCVDQGIVYNNWVLGKNTKIWFYA